MKFIAVPEWQKAKEADLRERYGRGAISARERVEAALERCMKRRAAG